MLFLVHTHTSCTHLLLGLSEGIEVSQHGVSVVFVLLPEVDSRLSGEDVLHALSGGLPHLNTGRQKQYISTQTACPSALTHLWLKMCHTVAELARRSCSRGWCRHTGTRWRWREMQPFHRGGLCHEARRWWRNPQGPALPDSRLPPL